MSTALIHADNMTLVRENRLLFKSLSFDLMQGQVIHLKGKNGSGKTSLFKVLMGALPLTCGHLKVFSKSFKDFEPQDYRSLFYLGHKNPIKPELTVEENVFFNAALFDGLTVTQDQVLCALECVGLKQYRYQCVGKLSAGQKRRVSLARLWLVLYQGRTEKKIWLLDEPLTALDAEFVEVLQEQMIAYLELGGALMVTSHQPLCLGREVRELCLGDFQ